MSQLTLNRIVEQLSDLDRNELCELGKVVASKTEVAEPEVEKASIYQPLVDQGILKRLPDRRTMSWTYFEPIVIEGNPLSETIIEERR